MIRTTIIPCKLNKETCDSLNLASGRIYSGIVSRHWKLLRRKGLWLSEKSLTKLSDLRPSVGDSPMHAHTIDAAQQGFFKACVTARAIRKTDPTVNFPWRSKKFRTTTWKNTAIKLDGRTITLSQGRGRDKIVITLPNHLGDILQVREVRLVFNKKARRYDWHLVIENGKQPKPAPGTNVVSVDLGEIHPAVVGDEDEAVVITMRQLRSEKQGHAKRLAEINRSLSRKKKGSRRYKKLVRARNRMTAKHEAVTRDMEHKVSRAVVDIAVERKAGTIVIGDVRDVADGTKQQKRLNRKTRQKISQWSHGKVRSYIEYKAEAEGIETVLQDEHYTSQTCPNCGERHKPRGRTYRCPSCGFQTHRDVVGQVNILSAHKHGTPGRIAAPTTVKYRIPHNLRVMRRRPDTGQTESRSPSVAHNAQNVRCEKLLRL